MVRNYTTTTQRKVYHVCNIIGAQSAYRGRHWLASLTGHLSLPVCPPAALSPTNRGPCQHCPAATPSLDANPQAFFNCPLPAHWHCQWHKSAAHPVSECHPGLTHSVVTPTAGAHGHIQYYLVPTLLQVLHNLKSFGSCCQCKCVLQRDRCPNLKPQLETPVLVGGSRTPSLRLGIRVRRRSSSISHYFRSHRANVPSPGFLAGGRVV